MTEKEFQQTINGVDLSEDEKKVLRQGFGIEAFDLPKDRLEDALWKRSFRFALFKIKS